MGLPKLRTRVRFPSPALDEHRRSNERFGASDSRSVLRNRVTKNGFVSSDGMVVPQKVRVLSYSI
jgi:hypothetical protein